MVNMANQYKIDKNWINYSHLITSYVYECICTSIQTSYENMYLILSYFIYTWFSVSKIFH